jgi:hypothetical protein
MGGIDAVSAEVGRGEGELDPDKTTAKKAGPLPIL